jgi:hypothetical protein
MGANRSFAFLVPFAVKSFFLTAEGAEESVFADATTRRSVACLGNSC